MSTNIPCISDGENRQFSKEDLTMSDRTRRRGAKAVKHQVTSAERQERKRETRDALKDVCAGMDGQEVFEEVDAVLKRILAKASTVVEVNSRPAPADDASAEELETLYDIMLDEAQMVPETLFYWPVQGKYMMVFEVDGQTWVYMVNDPVDRGPKSLVPLSVKTHCDLLPRDEPL